MKIVLKIIWSACRVVEPSHTTTQTLYTSQLVKQHFEGERKINKIKRDRERDGVKGRKGERVEKRLLLKEEKWQGKRFCMRKKERRGWRWGGEEKVLLEAGQVSRAVYTHTHTHTHTHTQSHTNIYHIQYIHKKHNFNVNDNIITNFEWLGCVRKETFWHIWLSKYCKY